MECSSLGCQRKNFLPPSYGKKKYTDLTNEEKSVIDSYEGEKEYNEAYEQGYATLGSGLFMLGGGKNDAV